MMKIILLVATLLVFFTTAEGTLAGGRPNAFSGGQNAFAGIVNPANAVWIEDRFDVGAFWLHQKSSLDNRDNNPLFLPGKTDLTYRTKNLFSADAAVHKRFKLKNYPKPNEHSVSIAIYSTPTVLKLRTKKPIPISGTTPLLVSNKIEAASVIFSTKLNASHSLGLSIDYLYFSHCRKGFQNSDNPLRSISPGHVTNNGYDHSHGIGMTIGWRWKITKFLDFGTAWTKKSYCGQYRKYRGYEPHHATNYFPQTFGAGFGYALSAKLAGRLEVLWINQGNLPGSNNNILPNGKLNTHKRGSNKSPGPGLQDATFINAGFGYQWNPNLATGIGYSHRIRLKRSSNILSHSYHLQTIYDILSFGANLNYRKHDLYLIFSYGFKNRVSGHMPIEIGGGQFVAERSIASFSISWGYEY